MCNYWIIILYAHLKIKMKNGKRIKFISFRCVQIINKWNYKHVNLLLHSDNSNVADSHAFYAVNYKFNIISNLIYNIKLNSIFT